MSIESSSCKIGHEYLQVNYAPEFIKMMHVWISSVVSTIQDLDYLHSAIESVARLRPKPKLVLSLYSTLSLDRLSRTRLEYKVVVRNRVYSQFEHIEALVQTQDVDDEDFIMFLDDNDILLRNTSAHIRPGVNGFIGYQLLGLDCNGEMIPGAEIATIDTINNLIITHYREMQKANGFSGTALRFKYLKEYFEQEHPNVSGFHRQVEDILLMKFIEEKVPGVIDIHDVPFVFRRIKTTRSLWTTNWIQDMIRGCW